MITLWGLRNSSNVQKVTWALGELGLAFERRDLGGSFGGTRDPDYLAINPNGLVPTIRDGGLVLFESDAILRHLARRHGEGTLWPRDVGQAALADQWTGWATTTFYPAVRPLFFASVRTRRAEQDLSSLGPAAERLAPVIAILERALEGRRFLLGDALTFGDIGPAIVARRALLVPHGAPAAPNVARWLDRLRERPAFRDHVDLPMGTCLEEWLEHEKALGATGKKDHERRADFRK